MPAVLCHAYTLLIVMIGWVFFRSQDLPYAIDFIGRLFGGDARRKSMSSSAVLFRRKCSR